MSRLPFLLGLLGPEISAPLLDLRSQDEALAQSRGISGDREALSDVQAFVPAQKRAGQERPEVSEVSLYDLLDFILNRASATELEAIRAAVRRREGRAESEVSSRTARGTGPLGIDVRGMASKAAAEMKENIGVSREEIRQMVGRLAKNVLEREAPELDKASLDELLEAWVSPKRGGDYGFDEDSGLPATSLANDPSTGATLSGGGDPSGRLSSDHIRTMIAHFIAYSTGAMNVAEEMALTAQIPDWHQRYWEIFPPDIRRLITLFLNGTIGSPEFDSGLNDALGSGGSPARGE